MPKEQSRWKPTGRRYSPEEKAAAVRMVRTLRAEVGTEHGPGHRVVGRRGSGVERGRPWAPKAEIGAAYAPAVTRPAGGGAQKPGGPEPVAGSEIRNRAATVR